MKPSAEISRSIYEQLTPAGLAARTTPAWDRRTVERVAAMLPPRQRLLDAGCGYGRIAIPLAQAGHEVVGIDICQQMLDESQAGAERVGATLELHLGELCALPFPDAAFDVVLCLWLTFNELLQPAEQVAAAQEIKRVLRPGGWALIDGPPFREEIGDEAASGCSLQRDTDLSESPIAAAFAEILAKAGVTQYELFVDDCPGRPRCFLRLWNS